MLEQHSKNASKPIVINISRALLDDILTNGISYDLYWSLEHRAYRYLQRHAFGPIQAFESQPGRIREVTPELLARVETRGLTQDIYDNLTWPTYWHLKQTCPDRIRAYEAGIKGGLDDWVKESRQQQQLDETLLQWLPQEIKMPENEGLHRDQLAKKVWEWMNKLP